MAGCSVAWMVERMGLKLVETLAAWKDDMRVAMKGLWTAATMALCSAAYWALNLVECLDTQKADS